MTTDEIMRLAMDATNSEVKCGVSGWSRACDCGPKQRALYSAIDTLVAERDALRTALQRVVDSEESHSTLHASDGDDVARMIEWVEAFDAARAALKGKT